MDVIGSMETTTAKKTPRPCREYPTTGSGPYGILGDLESRTSVLKVKELASIFRVSEDAIYDLADQGTIPSFTIGKQRRFDSKTVAYWLRKKDPTFAMAVKTA
jgi:excisionase family DNA binding protein